MHIAKENYVSFHFQDQQSWLALLWKKYMEVLVEKKNDNVALDHNPYAIAWRKKKVNKLTVLLDMLLRNFSRQLHFTNSKRRTINNLNVSNEDTVNRRQDKVLRSFKENHQAKLYTRLP